MVTVKYRHIGMHEVRTDSTHADRSEAVRRAEQINNKPFTPYYAWVAVETSPIAARNSYIG